MEKVVINTKDLLNNIDIVKKTVKNNSNNKKTKIIGVVKGNGYGLGLIQLANILIENGIDILAVSKIEEAVELRKNNIDNEIILLSSTSIESDIEILIKNNITPTIGNIDSLEKFNKIATDLDRKIKVHLMLETGFGRTGIKYSDISKFISSYKKCSNIEIYGIYTHFNSSFLENRKNVDKQYKEYIKIVEELKKNNITANMLHVCNSSAVFKYPEYYLDAVRVGSAFTGKMSTKDKFGLKPVGELETSVNQIEKISKGQTIGYGKMFVAQKDMDVAIIQTGYSSGVGLQVYDNNTRFVDKLRKTYHDLKNFIKTPKIYANINNRRYEIISGIRMNDIIVDITDSKIKPGDKVTLKTNLVLVDTNIERRYI